MSVIYCHVGGHYVDTDFEESVTVGGDEICFDCLENKIESLRNILEDYTYSPDAQWKAQRQLAELEKAYGSS